MTQPNPYDEVPYGESAHPASHPGRAAAIAALLGLTPAPLERCRVLELGCAGGSNLIPMAALLPSSEFVGLDYSARQIENGQQIITALGLTNIRLHALDIRTMDESWGTFDYIIAHGLYSWVAADVREQVMLICKRHLAPNGIAYLSYNTYPGWRMLQIAREAMQFRTRSTESPLLRAEQGREFIQFLAGAPIQEQNAMWNALMQHYNGLMQLEAALLGSKPASVMLHDELEAVNDPCYFIDFVEHAARHGLEYLSEVDFPTMLTSNLPPTAAAGIQKMATNLLEAEQYIDFVRNRTFRQTLLVHQGAPINRQLTPQRLAAAGLYFSSAAASKPDSAAQPNDAVKFLAEDGAAFTTADPFIKTMFQCLRAHFPAALSLDELTDEVLSIVTPALNKLPSRAELQQHLAAHALAAFARTTGLIDLQAYRPPFTVTVSEHPRVSDLTHYQLMHGAVVTALTHENYQLDTAGIVLGTVMDGTRSHADLEAIFQKLLVRSKRETVKAYKARLRREVAKQLEWFARHALLIG